MKNIISICCLLAIFYACQPSATNPSTSIAGASSKKAAYTLQYHEGEVSIDAQGRTNILKVSPETGASLLTMGTTEMPKGTGILVHKHDKMEEILFVHHGRGLAIINDDTIKIEKGATLFIPPGTWHGVQNPTDSMVILFLASPQGLEKLFRGIGTPPGSPFKKLTPAQMDSIEKVSDSKARKNQ